MIFTKHGEISIDGTGSELLADLGVCIIRIFELMAETVGDTFTEKGIRWTVDQALKEADHFGDPSMDKLLSKVQDLLDEKTKENDADAKALKERIEIVLKGVEDNG